jgi:hypothetical protein
VAALLGASGWRRLEIIGGGGLFGGRPHGWCERADGTGVHLADVLERAARVPGVIVPRYAAPAVTVTPVTAVISPAPATDRHAPGHYQSLLLDTRTGELRFHESTQHLEPLDLARTASGDVPPETLARWYPGTLFTANGGPHTWFSPVPGLLRWVIDSGEYVRGRPYLDADNAGTLLRVAAPYAQDLLNGLFDTGELDWSAAAVAAGQAVGGLCSRDGLGYPGKEGEGLADYGDIVSRFPYVYRPELLTVPPDQLAGQCEPITRFLGSNEHWHPEVKEAFGTPETESSYRALDVLGVRAWYRAASGVTS